MYKNYDSFRHKIQQFKNRTQILVLARKFYKNAYNYLSLMKN